MTVKRGDFTSPADEAVVVVPSDTVNQFGTGATSPLTRGLYVGGTGDVSVQMANIGTAVVFKAVPVGTILPIIITRVNSTNTTASLMVALI